MSNRRTRKAKKEAVAPEESSFADDSVSVESTTSWGSRLWSWTKVLAGVSLVLAVSGAVAWAAHRYALTTPRFAIVDAEVDGLRRLSADKVLGLAGIARGDNVFALDVAEAERRLVESPWVAEARITRRLPGQVRVEISEREAGALLAVGEELFLVTRAGQPFKKLETGDPYDLPVVTGVTAAMLARDRERALEGVAEALELIRHYERLPLGAVFPAQEVHLSEGGSATLTVGKQGMALHLGPGPWKQKLLRAARVVERSQARGTLPGMVFLDNDAHPERVVVRMR